MDPCAFFRKLQFHIIWFFISPSRLISPYFPFPLIFQFPCTMGEDIRIFHIEIIHLIGCNITICKAAVINGCIHLIAGKHFIYSIRPVCSPDTELLITVPLFRNRVLSAVAATFRMLFILIDSAGHTGVVLLCCEISIRKSEVKDIEWKLSWNWEKRWYVVLY